MRDWQQALKNIERPFAWMDEQALYRNIDWVAQQTEKPIRIATKSVRSVEVLRMIEQRLPHVAGFMTFTAAETLYLVEQGFDRLLLGYPVMEQQAVCGLLAHIRDGKDITFMVDAVEQVRWLMQLAEPYGVRVPICIDLNVSMDLGVVYFGTKRSPLHNDETLSRFLVAIRKWPVEVRGVMAYEAQIAGVPDQAKDAGLKNGVIRGLKRQSQKRITVLHEALLKRVRQFYEPAFINGGGSGSMAFSDALAVTELTVGSAFLAPALFDGYESLSLAKASGFALAVVRQFDAQTFVCHGGGYVASGASGKDRLPVFYEEGRFRLTSLEGAGEVQTPIVDREQALRIGDTVYFRHAKAGELCERFNALHMVSAAGEVKQVTTYRGDGQCFL